MTNIVYCLDENKDFSLLIDLDKISLISIETKTIIVDGETVRIEDKNLLQAIAKQKHSLSLPLHATQLF